MFFNRLYIQDKYYNRLAILPGFILYFITDAYQSVFNNHLPNLIYNSAGVTLADSHDVMLVYSLALSLT